MARVNGIEPSCLRNRRTKGVSLGRAFRLDRVGFSVRSDFDVAMPGSDIDLRACCAIDIRRLLPWVAEAVLGVIFQTRRHSHYWLDHCGKLLIAIKPVMRHSQHSALQLLWSYCL